VGAFEDFEVTATIAANSTVLEVGFVQAFSGKTVYCGQEILIFGASIGIGKYQPTPGETVWLQNPVSLLSNTTIASGLTTMIPRYIRTELLEKTSGLQDFPAWTEHGSV